MSIGTLLDNSCHIQIVLLNQEKIMPFANENPKIFRLCGMTCKNRIIWETSMLRAGPTGE